MTAEERKGPWKGSVLPSLQLGKVGGPSITPQPWRRMCWGLQKRVVWICGLGSLVTSKQKGPSRVKCLFGPVTPGEAGLKAEIWGLWAQRRCLKPWVWDELGQVAYGDFGEMGGTREGHE